jgi:hypothetical protein
MVRYADAWTNNAPNAFGNLWGDDPFPAVDSLLGPAGKSFCVAEPDDRFKAVSTLRVLVSTNQEDRHARRHAARLNSQP